MPVACRAEHVGWLGTRVKRGWKSVYIDTPTPTFRLLFFYCSFTFLLHFF